MWNIAESFDDQMIPITWYEGVQHEHSIHLQAGDDVALGVDGTHGMISKTLELSHIVWKLWVDHFDFDLIFLSTNGNIVSLTLLLFRCTCMHIYRVSQFTNVFTQDLRWRGCHWRSLPVHERFVGEEILRQNGAKKTSAWFKPSNFLITSQKYLSDPYFEQGPEDGVSLLKPTDTQCHTKIPLVKGVNSPLCKKG